MKIEEMKARKRELGLTNEMLAERSGIPLGTVQKIFGGTTKAPRKATLDALAKALYMGNPAPGFHYMTGSDRLYVKEEAAAYLPVPGGKGGYTTEDYYALPDDERVELIDGIFYDMASPTRLHQGIIGGIFVQLDRCVERHAGRCFLYASPSDVELGDKNDTVVQPDIYIHCDPDKEEIGPMRGAPDFVLEVLSPSSRKHDLIRKLAVYSERGVREYWIVDPESRKIIVYYLENELVPEIYTFDDEVPVHISNDECRVDFKKVYERVKHFYEK